MKKFRVMLTETVKYHVDVLAEDAEQASEIAQELWAASADPTNDFCGEGQGVETDDTWEDPPNWTAAEAAAPQDPRVVSYRGWLEGSDFMVSSTVNGIVQHLRTRNDLRDHSPDGLAWGYCGSGPAQLALAMLCEHFGQSEQGDRIALALYQPFKAGVISKLDRHQGWTMTGDEITDWIAKFRGIGLPIPSEDVARIAGVRDLENWTEAAMHQWGMDVPQTAFLPGTSMSVMRRAIIKWNDTTQSWVQFCTTRGIAITEAPVPQKGALTL